MDETKHKIIELSAADTKRLKDIIGLIPNGGDDSQVMRIYRELNRACSALHDEQRRAAQARVDEAVAELDRARAALGRIP